MSEPSRAEDPEPLPDEVQRGLAAIAKRHLFMETLEPRHSDCLDFYDVGVASVRAALEAAWRLGRESAD